MGIVRDGDRVILDGCEVCDWDAMVAAYRRRIEQYGGDHRAFFYTDAALHARRLAFAGRVLAPLIGPEDTVLDVGCGDGGLIAHLPPCRYTGVDIVPEFVERARAGHPDRSFLCAGALDVAERFDWVLVIGTTGTTPDVQRILEHGWSLARAGMVFDVLDARRDPGGDRNSCRAGDVVEFLMDAGAERIAVEPTPDPWTFFTAWKGPAPAPDGLREQL